jgi:hypothetical protein
MPLASAAAAHPLQLGVEDVDGVETNRAVSGAN